MSEPEIPPFPIRYQQALSDPQLRRTLLAFQRKWRVDRDRAVENVDFERERQRLAAAKNDVIDHLPAYIQQFKAEAEANGAQVYQAKTPEDAIRYILDVARARGIGSAVKSKTMVSEEIELNHDLEAAGVRVVETDLGEWILQLAGDRPSHIIAPAIHMNRLQVAELFSRVLSLEVSREDISEQVLLARRALREEFLAGQMGISGANALVAESGTVMLVTNEGNAELVTSVPSVHVVLAGIEKLVPTFDDAMLQLTLLAPSATGQAATSYVSWITGPTGPHQELHIVLLDNGRMDMRASPLFADALRCIRCGACSNVCPSYGVVGGHVFGYVYTGAIGLVNTPFHHGLENDAGPQSLCVSCNACQTVCPVDIPLPRQILDNRAWVAREEGLPLQQRLGMAIWSNGRLFQAAARLGAVLQRPIRCGPFLEPPGLGKLTSWRKLPALADRPFRDQWPGNGLASVPGPLGRTLEGLTVGYFVQCLTDWIYPEIGVDTVDVLRGLGARVVFPRRQHCCGLPALDSGALKQGKRMARQTIETLEGCAADYIVSGGTSCIIAMLHEYGHLFEDEPGWQVRARRQTERVLDFTSFMHRVVKLPEGSLAGADGGAATYHYFCQSYNVLGFREEPLRLLEVVCGLDLRPLPEANVCCGFGGSVSFNRPEVCAHILERKLDNLDTVDVSLLITDNPGCIMHLRGGIAATGRKVEVKHPAQVVAERLRAVQTRG